MKKVCLWLAIISAIVLFITLGVVGGKLLDGNYDTTAEVIITGISFVIFLGSVVCYKFIGSRCPQWGQNLDLPSKVSLTLPQCGQRLPINL